MNNDKPDDDSMSQTASQVPLYRGSKKHKNRPTSDRKGTLCPEWTHTTSEGSFHTDPFAHKWSDTEALRLFMESDTLPGLERRYATAKGIAFEAKPTNDGTWHGYPVPWEAVPEEIVARWIDNQKVTRRQIKRHWRKEKDDLKWALGEDIE